MPYVPAHPILRRKPNRLHKAWVLIGRSSADDWDEVWTWSRRLVRGIVRALDPDRGWYDSYKTKAGLSYEKPFLQRNIADREMHTAITQVEHPSISVSFTTMPNDSTTSLIVDRVLDLLISDGVLAHPTVHAFRPVVKTSVISKSEVADRSVTRDKVWAVDRPAAELWLVSRLLLLEENAPPQER